MQIAKVTRSEVASWFVAFAAYCLMAWPDFFHISGDALIHFVYASNAAAGRWFQFNPGELSAGSTSIFYTTALVPLARALDLRGALYVACTACIVAVAALLWLICRATRRATGSAVWATCAGLAVAINPGLAYNSPQGIEAPFFALAVAALLFRDPAWATAPALARSSIAVALLAAVVVVLRPEGVVVLGVTLAVLAAGRRLDGRRVGASGPLLLAAGAGAAALVFAGIWQWRWTGVFLPASAYSRLMMARREGIHLGPLWIYPRFPMRLAAYGPLAAGTAAAPWLLRDEAGQARFARVALVVLVATFVMYTFVTGAAHVARYMMFLLPLMAVASVLTAWRLWRWRWGRWLVGLAGVALLASYGVETVTRVRWRRHSGSSTLGTVADQHDRRAQTTNDWLAKTNFDLGKCAKLRFTLQEVQTIVGFDDRAEVVSTDGRVWPIRVSGLFRQDGSIDGVRWIATLKPNVMLEQPFDPVLQMHMATCRERVPAVCPYGGVDWAWVDGVGAWVDSACMRSTAALPR